MNARSLNVCKLDYLKYLFASSCVDVICVSETWFKTILPDLSYNIPNYNLFRNDRVTLTNGGGVAIYCKSTLNCKVINKSSEHGVEYIVVEIHDGSTKCIVSCVYCNNRSCSPVPFFSVFSDYCALYEHLMYVAISMLTY